MSAAKYDLVIAKGEDYNFTLRILDSLDEPVPFLTYVSPTNPVYGKAEIREADRKPLAAAFTIGSVATTPPLTPTDGTLKFSLTSAQTLALDVNKRYKWDFFWFDAAGNNHKLLYGDVTVSPSITHIT
jgi:hypothetical protein